MSKETQPRNFGSELAPQEARGFASFQRGVDNFRNAHPDDPQMQNLADIGDSVVSSMQAVGNAALGTGQRVKENQAFAVATASVLLASFLAACEGEGRESSPEQPQDNTPVPAQTETPKPTNTPLPEAPAPATAVATEVATQEPTETPEPIVKRFNVNDLAAEGGHHVAEGVLMTDEIRETIIDETLSELGRVDAEHPLCNGNACEVYVFTGENGHQRQSYMLVTPNGETIIPINDQGEQWYGPSQGAIDMNLSEVVPAQVDKGGKALKPVMLNEFAVSADSETLVPGPIDRLAFADEEGNVLTMVISPFGDRYTQMWHPNAESSFPSDSPLLANGVPDNAELISVRDADNGSMYAGWLPVDEEDGSFKWDEGFTDGNGAQGYFVRGGGLANADAWTWIGDEPVPTATAETSNIFAADGTPLTEAEMELVRSNPFREYEDGVFNEATVEVNGATYTGYAVRYGNVVFLTTNEFLARTGNQALQLNPEFYDEANANLNRASNQQNALSFARETGEARNLLTVNALGEYSDDLFAQSDKYQYRDSTLGGLPVDEQESMKLLVFDDFQGQPEAHLLTALSPVDRGTYMGMQAGVVFYDFDTQQADIPVQYWLGSGVPASEDNLVMLGLTALADPILIAGEFADSGFLEGNNRAQLWYQTLLFGRTPEEVFSGQYPTSIVLGSIPQD